MADDTDLKNTDTASDRSSADRGDRDSDRGERHDRSLERNEHRERGRSIRDELRASFDEATRDDERPRRGEPSGRAARQAREATAEPGSAPDATGGADADAAVDLAVPPARLNKEQKEKWPGLGKSEEGKYWQAVIHKIDTDSRAGHEKDKRARQAEDAAWAPHDATIRSFGLDRAATVTRLMQWFEGLSRDPVRNFPALVKAMGAEQALLQHAQQQQAGAQAQQTNGGAFDPRVVQQYVDGRVGALEQQMMDQQQARTNEILSAWAKNKPHYERVRYRMSTLLQPNQYGISVIPLTPEGHVDLDSAYQAAVAMDPELSGQMVAEQVKAKLKAESERAQRSRYASSSLTPRAPGGNNSVGAPKRKTGSASVRDSINQAMAEIAER